MGSPVNTPDKQALKEASKQLVRAAGGVEAAALYVRPNKSTLSDYGRPENDIFMPVDVIAGLEAITHGTAGWPIVTRLLAMTAGCALVELPAPGNAEADWIDQLGQLSKETSDVAQGICKALHGDHRVTASEVRQLRLIDECDDLIAHIVTMRARLERILLDGS